MGQFSSDWFFGSNHNLNHNLNWVGFDIFIIKDSIKEDLKETSIHYTFLDGENGEIFPFQGGDTLGVEFGDSTYTPWENYY